MTDSASGSCSKNILHSIDLIALESIKLIGDMYENRGSLNFKCNIPDFLPNTIIEVGRSKKTHHLKRSS